MTVGRRRRIILKTFRALVALAVVLLLVALPAAAMDGMLALQRDVIADDEWEAIRKEFESSIPPAQLAIAVEWFVTEGRGQDAAGVWAWLRHDVVHAARVDLTGDGAPELVIGYFAEPFCGYLDCSGEIWRQDNAGWHLAADLPLPDTNDPCLRTLAAGEPPYVITSLAAVWWSGAGFERLYLDYETMGIHAIPADLWPLRDKLAATDLLTCQPTPR
jgi:hypothetical protein